MSDRDGENDRQIEEWDVDREGGRIDSDERGRGYRQRWGDIERWGNIERTGGDRNRKGRDWQKGGGDKPIKGWIWKGE